MSGNKKSFDRESMYKKIMPTNLNKEVKGEEKLPLSVNIEANNSKINTLFQNKELNLIKDDRKEKILYNITEKLVLSKFDGVLGKTNCCRCDRCKQDIVAIALNNLRPMYIVATRDEIDKKLNDLEEEGSKVTTELIKAVLTVRKSPRH